MIKKIKFFILVLLFIQLFGAITSTGWSFDHKPIFHPVLSQNAMVATQNHHATKAGLEILKQGGNAIDAAVTIGFTLAVTLPHAGNLGGGGFMPIYIEKTGEIIAVDYREKAPKKATRDMFLDKQGNVDPVKSRYSYLAAGVPGTVAGLTTALEKYGTISLKQALKPAIELAEKGFSLDYYLRQSLIAAKSHMKASKASMEIFFKENGEPYKVGQLLIQKDLAWSLKHIAAHGADGFYKGEIADLIASDMKANGGLITKDDLSSYKSVIRKPIHGTYRGYDIYSMPPPSSGGIHLIQILNMLEHFPLSEMGHNSAQTIHIMAECMKRVYADRSKFIGDSDFVPVPINGLISKKYASQLKSLINTDKAIPSSKILPGNPGKYESNETTHFSVIDQYGNAVSNTYTLNLSYGSGITIEKTGILLNNEMDDFSAKPGIPNAFGLTGGEFNSIEPEKRMLSSMSPTIVIKNKKPFLVTGSPGGSRIITTTLQIILNVIDHKMNIAEATNSVRIHHQWLPDELSIEKGLSPDTISLLKRKGHNVVVRNAIGSTQSIVFANGLLYGASDPRKPGALTLGY